MTIEEKRKRIKIFCENIDANCEKCPLSDSKHCYLLATDEEIEHNYNLVFGSDCCDDCEFYECAEFDFPCKDCINNYGGSGLNNCFKPINSGTVPEEINHPDRYAGGKYECIKVMVDVFGADAVKHFCILNAFKYVWRAEKKNGVEDIKKAIWYLNKYIELGGERNA